MARLDETQLTQLQRDFFPELGGTAQPVLRLVYGIIFDFDDTLATLSRLARRTLVVEFVALEDDKIRDDPGFFPNLRRFDPATYSIEQVRAIGLRHFSRAELRPSHPGSRTLLVFDR